MCQFLFAPMTSSQGTRLDILYFINFNNAIFVTRLLGVKTGFGRKNPFFYGIKFRTFLNINIRNFETFNEFKKLGNYQIRSLNLLLQFVLSVVICFNLPR